MAQTEISPPINCGPNLSNQIPADPEEFFFLPQFVKLVFIKLLHQFLPSNLEAKTDKSYFCSLFG